VPSLVEINLPPPEPPKPEPQAPNPKKSASGLFSRIFGPKRE
jgi:hypothetical protein